MKNDGVLPDLSELLDAEAYEAADHLLSAMAEDIYRDGFSVRENALPAAIAETMAQALLAKPLTDFNRAGIGRAEKHTHNEAVRSDRIHWITSESAERLAWLAWAEAFKSHINRRLYLGLFSFESHFAHYAPGDFYKRHNDAFKGQANRMLSLVVYLNRDWDINNGGELVLYKTAQDQEGVRVAPRFATVVAFLSEEFPHEVLPATCDRYSIAGWFRINSSNSKKIDPPS